MHNTNTNEVDLADVDRDDLPEQPAQRWLYLWYWRKSKRHNWSILHLHGNTPEEKIHALHIASQFLKNVEKVSPECNYQLQEVHFNATEYSGIINTIDNLPASVNWLEYHMIPLSSMEQHPNQMIHNGGN